MNSITYPWFKQPTTREDFTKGRRVVVVGSIMSLIYSRVV